MGLLVDGDWHNQWYDTQSTGGRFVRKDAGFRNWVTSRFTQVGGYRNRRAVGRARLLEIQRNGPEVMTAGPSSSPLSVRTKLRRSFPTHCPGKVERRVRSEP